MKKIKKEMKLAIEDGTYNPVGDNWTVGGIETAADQCVIIAQDYAKRFAEWIDNNNFMITEKYYWMRRFDDGIHERFTTSELLKEFDEQEQNSQVVSPEKCSHDWNTYQDKEICKKCGLIVYGDTGAR